KSGERIKGLDWSKPGFVSLQQRQGLHTEGVRAVFSTDTSQLPSYAGLSVEDGRYVIYRISKVENVESVSPDQLQTARRQLAQMAQQEQYLSFLRSMRDRTKVEVREDRINPEQP
ncbi:MAG: hypothetical protein PVI98_09510, partial [Burkholderiales bacterium]